MITGKNILLRSVEESDWILIKKWNFDQNVASYFSPRLPISDIEQKKWFESQIGKSDKKKLIIIEQVSQKPIGMIGLMSIDHINKSVEIGVTIGEQEFAGKGLAKDAMLTIMAFMFNQQNMNQIYLTTFEKNIAAIKLFNSVGFTVSATLPQRTFINNKYENWVYMTIFKNEFSK